MLNKSLAEKIAYVFNGILENVIPGINLGCGL